MIKRVLFTALAVWAALCACTREPMDNNTNPEVNTGEEVMVTINASLEGCSDPETKTYLSGTELKQYDTPLWESEDSFKLIPHNGAPQTVFTLIGEGGETQGSFNGTTAASAGALNFSAVYPSSLENITRNGGSAEQKYTISFDLPSEQSGSANNADGQMPAFAYAFRENTSTTDPPVFDNVRFYNVCGLFRIALTSASPVKVGKLEIIDINEDAKLWGTAYISMINGVDYTAGPNKWNFKLLNGDDDAHVLTVNYSPAVSLDSSDPTYFYAAIPPGTLSSGVTVVVYDDSDNEIDRFSKSSSLEVARAHIKPMATKPLKYTSLSDEGTANCYIVENAGLYKFQAVKGNSNESVGTVDNVEVLWESDGTTTAPAVGSIVSSVGFKDNNVHFSTTGTAGNALIAAKDSNEKILWSWHIWVPSSAESDIEITKESPYTSVTFMDRNLGALVASNIDGSVGMLYQWGRKDPFTGRVKGSTTMATTSSITSTTRTQGTNAAWSIENPTVFVDVYAGNGTHWAGEDSDSWAEASWSEDSKTIYDPCPYGYRVSSKTDMQGLALGDWDSDHLWRQAGTSTLYFGATGRRYFSSLGAHTIESIDGYYWTCTSHSSASGKAYICSVKSDQAGTISDGGLGKSFGCAVRCVKDE